jgi:shikimate kinase
MNLYLIGYRGSGKTTVGRLVADELGFPFVDTDVEIEKTAETPIREIFSDRGEEVFRDLETQAIQCTLDLNHTIVSLGGGACQRKTNREIINQGGKSVWLTGDAETLWQRISSDLVSDEQRPNLTGLEGLEEVKQLLEQRHENYAACADYKIDTRELPPHEVASQIVQWWNSVDTK